MKFLKSGFKYIFLLLTIWFLGGLAASWVSTHPRLVEIESAEKYFGAAFPAEELNLKTTDDKKVAGWYIPNNGSPSVVILLAGIGGNRVGMVDRAKIYLEQGFGVLLPDLRGTGESDEGIISYSWGERLDLLAAVDFLKNKNIAHIGVHGCSLGAATISYSFLHTTAYDFVVLESPYDNIKQALVNRLDLYGLPLFPFQSMIWWTEKRIGAETDLLAPENYVHAYPGPILLLAGDSELKVKKQETEKIFSNIKSPNKQLYFFKGAKHEDFLRRDAVDYKKVLAPWIASFSPQKNN